MLRSVKDLQKYTLVANGKETGEVDDFYFDDHEWTIRYLVADLGGWFEDNRVLIGPDKLADPDWISQRFPVTLTKAEVEDSPAVTAIHPVSEQLELEKEQKATYSWPPLSHLGGGLLHENVIGMHPQAVVETTKARAEATEDIPTDDVQTTAPVPNLRSTTHVMGYYIAARDGDIGHVEDFLVDDVNWSINYIIVDTRNWLPGGKKVLVAPTWIEQVNWAEAKVHVDLSQEMIENSPEYDPDVPLSPKDQENIRKHYTKVGQGTGYVPDD